jgi:hypothetical protein
VTQTLKVNVKVIVKATLFLHVLRFCPLSMEAVAYNAFL